MDTTTWIQNGGLLLICVLVFSTTGLFCFFLPVGAVLFTTGVLLASGSLPYNLIMVCLVLTLSAIAGNCTSYGLGRRMGPALYGMKETWYFKLKHLITAEKFYTHYGKWAIAVGLFLPIIRTFSPVVAGIVRLPFTRLLVFSAIGSAAWILSFVGAGFFIGSRPLLRPYLPWIVGGFIIIVTVPLLIRIIRTFRK